MTIDIREFSEPFFPAIGRAIIAWAKLEIRADEQLIAMLSHKTSYAVRQMLGIHVLDHIPSSFRARLKIIDDLAPVFYNGAPLAELLAITKACRDEIRDRNKLAHGEWHLKPTRKRSYQMMCAMRRHGLRTGKERSFTVAQINRKTKTYSELGEAYVRFSMAHHPDGPLPERLRRIFDNLRNSHAASDHPAN